MATGVAKGYGDWYLQNAPRTIWGRWMQGAPAAAEGGIDVPLPAGTPVYALGSGTLQGYGNFWHPNGNPGYGVLTERTNIPGLGQADVYYQHMDLAGGFQNCTSGNCGGQIVTKGQLIGYSRSDPGEVEVGINPGWSGVWGDASKRPGPWVSDPRSYLESLASGQGGGMTSGGGTGSLFSTDIITSITEHVFLFLLALVLIVGGFVIIARKPIEQGTSTAARGVFFA